MIKTEVNIKDVASHAGVSTGTVSRVLRGEQGVRADNASRVHQAVEKLGYTLRGRRPLGSGRAPQYRKTGNLGLYLPKASSQWANHPMFNAVFEGLNRACAESGFHYLTEFGEHGLPKARMVAQQKIDGLLVKGGITSWVEELSKHMPVVGVNLNQPGIPFDQINCDDYHSGYSAAQYLWKHGHRRIAFLCNNIRHSMLLMRYQGYERFLRMQQQFDPAMIDITERQTILPSVPEAVYPKFDHVLSKWWTMPIDQRPTAVLVANDWNAAGLYQTAGRLGINIPDELSVLAFDNNIDLCNLLEPNLTSYQVAIEQTTYMAAMRLIQKIDQGPDDAHPVVQSVVGELVERHSVKTV
jgi:LacI family transcriptional regulator